MAQKEKIGSHSQPIIVGNEVDTRMQEILGLVTVNGGCSGTLLNPRWILTADHCISTNGRVGGPSATSVSITAAWFSGAVTATTLVRDWHGRGLDVALIQLGSDLKKKSDHIVLLGSRRPNKGETLLKYGRGINAYATAGPPAKAATSDGRYRTATFTVSNTSTNSYTLPANNAGQVGAGGDSGGPDFMDMKSGPPTTIMGVQSTCTPAGYVSDKKQWTWSTGISACQSVPVAGIAGEIYNAMKAPPAEYWYLQARHSGKCLHQHGATTGNGGAITQWDCLNRSNIKLKQVRRGDALFLQFGHSNKCVHLHGASKENDAAITQWDCIDQPNVKWRIENAGDGFVYVKNMATGKCLHQFGARRENGGRITQWDCVNLPNVQWKLVRAPS